MVAVSRAVVCQEGTYPMTDKTNLPTPVVNQAGGPPVNQRESPPVRVRLRRINANRVKAYPPDGESKAWWRRLKKPLVLNPATS